MICNTVPYPRRYVTGHGEQYPGAYRLDYDAPICSSPADIPDYAVRVLGSVSATPVQFRRTASRRADDGLTWHS